MTSELLHASEQRGTLTAVDGQHMLVCSCMHDDKLVCVTGAKQLIDKPSTRCPQHPFPVCWYVLLL